MKNLASRIFLNSNSKIRNAWWVAIFFIVLSLFLFPLIILSNAYNFEIKVWHQVILILIVSILCQTLSTRPIHELIGKFNGKWFKELTLGLLIGAALMALPALALTLFDVVEWELNALAPAAFIVGIAAMVSVVIAEELLFRGFIFQRMIDGFGIWPAQIIVAGLFLLTHLNNPGMNGTIKLFASINIFIASILFGMAYIKTKNLGMSIGIHLMANITQGILLGFGVSGERETSLFTPIIINTSQWITGGVFGLEASIVGLFTLILITILFYKTYPLSKYSKNN